MMDSDSRDGGRTQLCSARSEVKAAGCYIVQSSYRWKINRCGRETPDYIETVGRENWDSVVGSLETKSKLSPIRARESQTPWPVAEAASQRNREGDIHFPWFISQN